VTDWTTRVLVASAALLFAAAGATGIAYLRSAPVSAPATAPLPSATHRALPVVQARFTPSTVSIASIGQVDVAIVDATVESDNLEPPADVHVAGIWTDGAGLDSTTGTTTLVGHVNYVGQGDGAFHDLASVARGSSITTVDNTGVRTLWTVTAIEVTVKRTGVDPAVFAGPTGARRLVLVTCGGPFDANLHSYKDNVYVWASPKN
jgi:hypothetical protein